MSVCSTFCESGQTYPFRLKSSLEPVHDDIVFNVLVSLQLPHSLVDSLKTWLQILDVSGHGSLCERPTDKVSHSGVRNNEEVDVVLAALAPLHDPDGGLGRTVAGGGLANDNLIRTLHRQVQTVCLLFGHRTSVKSSQIYQITLKHFTLITYFT